MILLGSIFMLVGIRKGLKIIKNVPESEKKRWKTAVILLLFFLIGYIAFIFIIILELEFASNIITGLVFLGGAIFVYIVISISSESIIVIGKIDELNSINKKLKEVIIERDNAHEELKKSNEILEQRVVERTRQMQSKIDELDNFKNLTVDRELRMIELKKEMEELRKILKEKQ